MVETITVEAEEGHGFIPRQAIMDFVEYEGWIQEGIRDQRRRHIWGLPVGTIPKGKAAKKADKRARTRLRKAGLK